MAPLHPATSGQLVADSLHCELEPRQPLAQLVYEKTGGNPFFAIQFLTALEEERLAHVRSEGTAWDWDLIASKPKDLPTTSWI